MPALLLLTFFWVELSHDQPKKDLEIQSWTVSMDKNKQFIFSTLEVFFFPHCFALKAVNQAGRGMPALLFQQGAGV